MTVYAAIGILLAVLVILFVLHPLISGDGGEREGTERRSELAEQRRLLYEQIIELEFDQRVGKVSAADARELSARLLQQAAALLAAERATEETAEKEVEREIEALRRTLAAARRGGLGVAKS